MRQRRRRGVKKRRYRTPFFFDRTVPRDLYFSVQKRLNYLGYGAVWQPRSAVKGRNRDIREILDYCVARGIKLYATFSRKITIPPEYQNKIKLVRLKGGRKKTVNKIIALLFTELRSREKN